MNNEQGTDRGVIGLVTGPRVAGGLLVAATVLVNGAFIGLGTVFSYPQVLQEPAGQALQRFAADPVTIGALFAVLAAGAGLLAPIAVGTARLAGASRWSRAALVTGIAAAVVQVGGLLRWPVLVPALAATATDAGASVTQQAAAQQEYTVLGTVLGHIVGESGGYLLTVAFTVTLLIALRRRFVLPRVSTAAAVISVPMILAGLLVPVVPGASMLNFAGYVLWSTWTVTFGVRLLRTGTPGPARQRRPATVQPTVAVRAA